MALRSAFMMSMDAMAWSSSLRIPSSSLAWSPGREEEGNRSEKEREGRGRGGKKGREEGRERERRIGGGERE